MRITRLSCCIHLPCPGCPSSRRGTGSRCTWDDGSLQDCRSVKSGGERETERDRNYEAAVKKRPAERRAERYTKMNRLARASARFCNVTSALYRQYRLTRSKIFSKAISENKEVERQEDRVLSSNRGYLLFNAKRSTRVSRTRGATV